MGSTLESCDIGKSPSRNKENEELFSDRLAEVRKSCETLGGWCLVSIVMASLTLSGVLSRIAVICGLVGVVLGFIGASLPRKPEETDPAQLEETLEKKYKRRACVRIGIIVALLLGLAAILCSAWLNGFELYRP